MKKICALMMVFIIAAPMALCTIISTIKITDAINVYFGVYPGSLVGACVWIGVFLSFLVAMTACVIMFDKMYGMEKAVLKLYNWCGFLCFVPVMAWYFLSMAFLFPISAIRGMFNDYAMINQYHICGSLWLEVERAFSSRYLRYISFSWLSRYENACSEVYNAKTI